MLFNHCWLLYALHLIITSNYSTVISGVSLCNDQLSLKAFKQIRFNHCWLQTHYITLPQYTRIYSMENLAAGQLLPLLLLHAYVMTLLSANYFDFYFLDIYQPCKL